MSGTKWSVANSVQHDGLPSIDGTSVLGKVSNTLPDEFGLTPRMLFPLGRISSIEQSMVLASFVSCPDVDLVEQSQQHIQRDRLRYDNQSLERYLVEKFARATI